MCDKTVIGSCPKCGCESIAEVCEGEVHYPVLSWDEYGFPEEYGMDYLQRETLDVSQGERYLCNECGHRFSHPHLETVDRPRFDPDMISEGVCPYCKGADLEGIYQVSVAFPVDGWISSDEARMRMQDHRIVTDVAEIDRPPKFHCLSCDRVFDRPQIIMKERIVEYA